MSDKAKECYDVLKGYLEGHHWTEVKQAQWRKDSALFAVELRYVYGECTVHINRLDGQIDRGTELTLRGVSQGFVMHAVKTIEDQELNGAIL